MGEGSEGNALPGVDRAGNALNSDVQPEETVNYELGAKWDVLGSRLSLAAAVFRTEKQNTRVMTGINTYENVGQTRVDGLELSASGQITDRWQVFAGYSYLDSEQLDAGLVNVGTALAPIWQDAPSQGQQMPNTPRNSLSLWSSYVLTPKLTVGGGAFYVDKVFGNADNSVYVPAYWRYDAMANFKVSRTLDLQLNLQNLTDKVYYDKAYAAHFANQAAGRTALMSTNVHF